MRVRGRVSRLTLIFIVRERVSGLLFFRVRGHHEYHVVFVVIGTSHLPHCNRAPDEATRHEGTQEVGRFVGVPVSVHIRK